MPGQHCIKSWAKTQSLIAKSSDESELHGMVKALCATLGILTLAQELGGGLDARVHVGAAAANGIAEKSGTRSEGESSTA